MPSRVKPRARDATVVHNSARVANGSARQGAHVIEMQRRRLLLAFTEVLTEGGIEGASVGSICKRAGVSRRTFYEIFEDREACFIAAFEQALERVAARVVPAYERECKWNDRVRAGLSTLLEQLDAEPGLARLCVVETLRAGPQVSARRKHTVELLATAIDEGRSEAKLGNELPSLTAHGVVGGALSVIHGRLLEGGCQPLVELLGPLMGMIVHPYLGAGAARRELDRPPPKAHTKAAGAPSDPFKDLPIRFTYRTALVLATIANEGGQGSYPSNRHIADTAGISDEGQTSRLLGRLQHAGLIENHGEGQAKGEPNAWTLTERGNAVHLALAGR